MYCPSCDRDNGPASGLAERGYQCTACGAWPNSTWWYRYERQRPIVFGDTFDRYRLLGQIGETAATLSLSAERLDSGRPVSLVVYRPWLRETPDFGLAFRRVLALQQASEPELVTEIDHAGEVAGLCFVARPAVTLAPIAGLLGHPQDWRFVLAAIRRLCSLYATAERLGQTLGVHPASMFITSRTCTAAGDPYRTLPIRELERVCVDVFATGLTRRWVIDELDVRHHEVPMLDYTAPEALMGGTGRPSTDTYALGLLAYELVCGAKAFPAGGSPAQRITAQLKNAIVPASHLVAGIPREVDALIARCLDKNPARRFSAADELAAAIDQLA